MKNRNRPSCLSPPRFSVEIRQLWVRGGMSAGTPMGNPGVKKMKRKLLQQKSAEVQCIRRWIMTKVWERCPANLL